MSTLVKRGNNFFPSVFSDFFNADRFFDPSLLEMDISKSIPSVNIVENTKEFKIEMAAPGMAKKDFKVNVENNVLTIGAEKEEEKKEKHERYTRQEFSYSSFSRSFTLPQETDAEGIHCKYEEGLLKISVPKKGEHKKTIAKEISVS